MRRSPGSEKEKSQVSARRPARFVVESNVVSLGRLLALGSVPTVSTHTDKNSIGQLSTPYSIVAFHVAV